MSITSEETAPTTALPVGQCDVQVEFPPGRNPKLPAIYIMEDHPLQMGSGSAYYFIHDGTAEAAEEIYRLEVDKLKIPQGSHDEAIELGFLELFPGDIMFSRLKTSSNSGMDDIPVLWVTGSELYDEATRDAALSARNRALGTRALRTQSHAKPDPITGMKCGGTAWERSLKTKFDEKRGRCYPFGCTFQRQRALYSPCAAGKLTVADEHTLSMRKDLLQVASELAMKSLMEGPPPIVEAIRLNHNLLNTPRVGSAANFAYTSHQLNLAHAREWDSAETLADNMGLKFGGAHIDQLDSPGHFTNMVALSDLPDDIDPGRFFVVYPGVFSTLHNFVSVNFSGLRVHGGSPPIANRLTSDYEKEWAARCMIVSYAKIGPTSSEHKMPLMQLEPDWVLSITPEMLRPAAFDLEHKIDATSFVMEGPTVMSSASVIEFLARCFLILILTMISKLPSSLSVRVDSDVFLRSFIFTDEDGSVRRVGPWVDGPGWRNRRLSVDSQPNNDVDPADLEDQQLHLAGMRQRWREHENRCGGHIPSAVCCLADITPLEGWTSGEPLRKIKPLLFKNKPVHNTAATAGTSTDARSSASADRTNMNPRQVLDARPSKAATSKNQTNKNARHTADTVPSKATATGDSLAASQKQALSERSINAYLAGLLKSRPFASTSPTSPPGEPDRQSLCEQEREEGDDDIPLADDPEGLEHTSSPSRVLGKRPRALTVSPLPLSIVRPVVHEGVFGEDDSRRVKSKVVQDVLDKVWRSDGYRTLEIHMVDCAPLIVLPSNPPSDEAIRRYNDIVSATETPFPTTSLQDEHHTREVQNLRRLPKFLQGITSEIVFNDLRQVRNEVLYLVSNRQPSDATDCIDSLMDAESHLSAGPLNVEALTAVQHLWEGVGILERLEKVNSIRLRKLRSSIMLTSAVAWKWLLVTLPEIISDIVHQNSQERCPWLSDLMLAVHECLLSEDANVDLSPREYSLPLDPVRIATVNFEGYVIPGDEDYDGWVSLYTTIVSRIVEVWLGYPSLGKSRWQGVFVLNVIQTLGPDFLVLDLVWKKYKEADSDLARSTSLPPMLDVADFPLLDPCSELRRNIASMASLVDDYSAGRLYRHMDFNAESGPVIEYVSEGLSDLSLARVIRFKEFVLDCFKRVFRGEQLSNARLQNLLDTNPDKYSPFREHAPTRIHMSNINGPFSPRNVQTLSGLFSALVCRGVTFGTNFSRFGRTLLSSPTDFAVAVGECDHVITSKDLCDPCAYGTNNHHRKPELVSSYWSAVHEYPWPGMDAVVPLSFEECFQYFFPGTSPARFMYLGPLGSYLLTVDYVYAGLVVPPSIEQLAQMVYDLQKGPVQALCFLGLTPLTAKVQGESIFIDAFKAAHKMVLDSIPREYHNEAGLDIFVTEHALCKFVRANTTCKLAA